MPRDLPEWLQERLRTAPHAPGCYLMRDRTGEVVYVGKAADLRARLGQYFAPNPGDTRFFVGLLDRVLGSIDVLVASNAKEALIVENDLIKRYQPRFNVKLKDDKNFLNLRLRTDQPYPRLEVVRRQRAGDGADYFGPYDSASALRNTLRVVNRHFGLRTCTDRQLNNRSRPCLEHQIGRCPAPCVLPVSPEDYGERVAEVRLFLQGRAAPLLKRLRAKMEAAAQALEFEVAAHVRDQIAAIERSLTRQAVRLRGGQDVDCFGLHREGARAVVQLLTLRGGLVASTRSYPMRRMELPDEALVRGFLRAFYDGTRPVPDLVLTPVPLEDIEAWAEVLSEQRGRRVEVRWPQRGDKRRLVEMANRNALTSFQAQLGAEADARAALERLRDKLRLPALPRRIECYDISNIQGTDPVGSMVVALDGVLAPQAYRRFRVRSLETPDDFSMMREVLGRRLRRGQREGDLPDLILVDGGKGQLRVAEEVLAEVGVPGVELASLAKERALDERGHVKRGATGTPSSAAPVHSDERVFRPGRKNPVALRPNSEAMYLLVRLRDEAHRFAITYHKQRRRKRTLASALDAIPGVGEARKRALLRRFGSVRGVGEASVDELASTPGISQALAERIARALA